MKPLIARVLLATDFSHCAARALDYALAITSWWKAELQILHVLELLPGPSGPAGIASLRHLLIPIDFSACSLEALEYGVQLARYAGSAVTILHVLEPVAYGLDFTLGSSVEWRTQKAYVEGRLEILQALCTSNGINAEQVLKAGTPADSIRDYADRQQPDLVIMGTHGRRGVSRMLSGSVAEALLRLAPSPVLTVRTPVFGMGHERIMPAGAE